MTDHQHIFGPADKDGWQWCDCGASWRSNIFANHPTPPRQSKTAREIRRKNIDGFTAILMEQRTKLGNVFWFAKLLTSTGEHFGTASPPNLKAVRELDEHEQRALYVAYEWVVQCLREEHDK